MANQETVRGRVSPVLRRRLDAYIAQENARGRSVDDSTILREALVEFLDSHGGELHEEPAPYKTNSAATTVPASEDIEPAAETPEERIQRLADVVNPFAAAKRSRQAPTKELPKVPPYPAQKGAEIRPKSSDPEDAS